MAVIERSEMTKCIICRDTVKYGERVCHACYDAMRLGKPIKQKKR